MKALLDTVKEIFEKEQFIATPTELYEPIEYTLRLGGKRIRPVMLLAANQMFGGDAESVKNAAIGIETFHNFTLLHDDLMDKSPLRRGKPTVYCKWNENTAILSGDTMFALAWRYFLKQPHAHLQEILNCFNETAIEVCEGQQFDMKGVIFIIFFKFNLIQNTDYSHATFTSEQPVAVLQYYVSTCNFFHNAPFHWVAWSLSSIKAMEEIR